MRSLVNKVFTPRAIAAQEALVHELVDRYLAMLDPEGFDVVADFSALFPVEVITGMLGVPEDFRQTFRINQDIGLRREPGQVGMTDEGRQAMLENGMAIFNLIQERRVEPRDDMISSLIAVEVEREDGTSTKLDDVEIAGFAILLGGAGAETVTKLIGNAAVMFSRYPDQWAKLRADRSLIPSAIEELLRYDAPAQYAVRSTTRAIELHGVQIPADSTVMLVEASANRDDRAFNDAAGSISSETAPKPRTSDSATASTVVSVRHWPGWNAASRLIDCSISCPSSMSTMTGCVESP